MFFMGGGSFGGRGALSAENTLAQRKTPLTPPQTPPVLNLALGGFFRHDIRFPKIPPPLVTYSIWTPIYNPVETN